MEVGGVFTPLSGPLSASREHLKHRSISSSTELNDCEWKKKNVCTSFIKETVRETHTHCTPCSSLLVMQPPPGRCTHLENSQITTIRPLVLWTLMHPYYSKVLTGKLSWDHDVFLQIRGSIPAIVTHHVCFLFELNLV